jgi:hypothetical protein
VGVPEEYAVPAVHRRADLIIGGGHADLRRRSPARTPWSSADPRCPARPLSPQSRRPCAWPSRSAQLSSARRRLDLRRPFRWRAMSLIIRGASPAMRIFPVQREEWAVERRRIIRGSIRGLPAHSPIVCLLCA